MASALAISPNLFTWPVRALLVLANIPHFAWEPPALFLLSCEMPRDGPLSLPFASSGSTERGAAWCVCRMSSGCPTRSLAQPNDSLIQDEFHRNRGRHPSEKAARDTTLRIRWVGGNVLGLIQLVAVGSS
ncbi:hypothetical protein VFPPC_18237 [Pochonia chlamydosporia 170]|uniref:Uncharacterized protein n=1 Tax=Pochonia chlamydosporia 170 TaxID=1380566 RepID=A0A219AR25_METCM|nr:hypothetical protein VFPPC_18237 [Pochonia chlamydosporia 170]OWT42625.1 hypothetical protein VFPPC_18237 [Pochonia chlamydosporia 170]